MHEKTMAQACPAPHPDPEVDQVRPYITAAVTALHEAGYDVEESWLDPKGPIDATIRLRDFTLVWDEWTGWRLGEFVSGRQGVRTILTDVVHLGGAEMTPADLVAAVPNLALLPA